MIVKYWYYVPMAWGWSFGDTHMDILDLGNINLTKKFIIEKLTLEARRKGRVFLRYTPATASDKAALPADKDR